MARIRTIKPEFWTDEKTDDGASAYWLYCVCESDTLLVGPCKIGIATHLNKRLSGLQGGNWRPLILAWKVRLADRDRAKETEQRILMMLRPSLYVVDDRPRLASEWVAASPFQVLGLAVEYLNIEDDDVRRIA